MTKSEREQIAEILERRANEVASFTDEYRRDGKHFGSVELAMAELRAALAAQQTNVNR